MMLEKDINGFVNNNVLFMAKFTRAGIVCDIITLDDTTSEAFTFAPKSFTFATIDTTPPKDSTLLIKFFGFTQGDQLELLYKLLLEEEYRN